MGSVETIGPARLVEEAWNATEGRMWLVTTGVAPRFVGLDSLA